MCSSGKKPSVISTPPLAPKAHKACADAGRSIAVDPGSIHGTPVPAGLAGALSTCKNWSSPRTPQRHRRRCARHYFAGTGPDADRLAIRRQPALRLWVAQMSAHHPAGRRWVALVLTALVLRCPSALPAPGWRRITTAGVYRCGQADGLGWDSAVLTGQAGRCCCVTRAG
jgi:hypothetical protein